MIGLGLRLTVSGGREAVTRLVILAVAVALGVGMLLTSLAEINAVNTLNGRVGLSWVFRDSQAGAGPGAAPADAAPLWLRPSGDMFQGQLIDRFDVAATGPTSLVPPGIPRNPGPGQYYASPALVALLRTTPADQLADRYPGHLVGTIGQAGVPYANSLVIIIGHTPAQLAGGPNTVLLHSTGRNAISLAMPPGDNPAPASTIDFVFAIVALALLAPVVIFIATATRLSAARREQRLAALRLAGATRRQVSLLAAVESTLAAALGVAAGFGVFYLLRVPVAAIPFTSGPLYPGDLSLSLPDILAVAIGVPLAAVIAARLALRRVHLSPLGVARRATQPPPRAWRVLPLLAGAAEIGFFVVHGRPASVPGQIQAFLPGFLLIMVGLVTAGPWLTMVAARVMAALTSKPGTLIASRRLADDPQAAFRAVSGLVLALFITTVAVTGLATQDSKSVAPTGGTAAGILADTVGIPQPGLDADRLQPVAAPPASLLARLRQVNGVGGVLEVRAGAPGLTVATTSQSPAHPRTARRAAASAARASQATVPAGVVSCAQLATTPALGRCPAGATAVAFPQDITSGFADLAMRTWPAVSIPARQLDSAKAYALDVTTNGSAVTIERARTVLETSGSSSVYSAPQTLAEANTQVNSTNNAYAQLANGIILVSLPIAGCTLAVGIAGGLADRRRPFALLRLTGARLATLRRVVMLESAVPLLAVAAVAIGVGFGASAMYASVMIGRPLVTPGIAYYVITGAGIVVCLGIIAATLPLLTRLTGPEVARNE